MMKSRMKAGGRDVVREFGGLLAWPGPLAAAGATSEGAVALCAAALREEGRVVVAVLPTAHHAERFLGDVASVGKVVSDQWSAVSEKMPLAFFPMEAADDAESAGVRLAVARNIIGACRPDEVVSGQWSVVSGGTGSDDNS
ncbi:MAG: hypothetical protein FWF84_03790, partial [Kiritimatiellaeota bacterium]|nr:hypothetical protein [Kiritimatiellota bacterium]